MFLKAIERIYPTKQTVEEFMQDMILQRNTNMLPGESTWGDQTSINKTYENISWVYRCIDITATNIAKLPIKIFRDKDDVTDHPDFDIFKSPNKIQSIYDFIYESISRLRLQGELFWELTIENGKIVMMYADWSSDEVKVIPDPVDLIAGYKRQINNREFEFTPEEVFYVKYFNPFSNLRGMSPLRAARNPMILELNAMDYNKSFFKQGMQPSGSFTTDKSISPKEAERLQKTLQDHYAGQSTMHRPLVLWGGLQFDSFVKQTLRDAEFTELRKMNREDICSALGVTLEALGVGEKTFENVNQAKKMLWELTLIPTATKLQSLITKSLLPRLSRMSNLRFAFDTSDVEILKDDLEKKMLIFDKGFKAGAVTPNDIRVDVFGKDAIETPAMETTYLPISASPIEQRNEPTPQPQLSFHSRYEKASTFEERTKIWNDKIAKIDPHENAIEKEMKKFFKRQGKKVVANVKKVLSKKDFDKVHLETEGVIFDLQFWIKELNNQVDPLIIAALLDAMDEFVDLDTFDVTHPAIRGALGDRLLKYSQDVNTTTKKSIIKQINLGFDNAESVEQIAQRIATNVFGDETLLVRARRIARTEAVGASNFGTQKGLELTNRFQNKMWITSRDERVRDTHVEMEGKVIGINENFVLSDGKTMPFPQEINERCIHIGTLEPKN